jgi:hypothetical protein
VISILKDTDISVLMMEIKGLIGISRHVRVFEEGYQTDDNATAKGQQRRHQQPFDSTLIKHQKTDIQPSMDALMDQLHLGDSVISNLIILNKYSFI